MPKKIKTKKIKDEDTPEEEDIIDVEEAPKKTKTKTKMLSRVVKRKSKQTDKEIDTKPKDDPIIKQQPKDEEKIDTQTKTIVAKENNDIDLNIDSFYLFNGTSRSGKTHLMKYLLFNLLKQQKNKLKYVIILSGTAFTDQWPMFPQKYVREYNEDFFAKFLKVIEKMPKEKREKYHGVVVFDDCLGENFNSPLLTSYFSKYRWYGHTVFMTTQFINKVSTLIREQTEKCFMFTMSTKRLLDATFETYGASSFDSVKDWRAFFQRTITEPHQCLVFDKNEVDVTKKFSTFIAPKDLPKTKYKF